MNQEEALELLKKVMQINSVLGNESEVADLLQQVFEKYGIDCEQLEDIPGRNQLIATIEGDGLGPNLALSGHMDVVPIGNEAWQYDPFGAVVTDDGRLHGRGSSDMKSGLVAMLVAMINFKLSRPSFKGKLQFIASMGEESNSIGAKQLVELGLLDSIDAMIIAEPTNNQLCVSHKGALWFQLSTKGKISHGSMPELGINAIDHLLEVLNEMAPLFDKMKATDELLGDSTWSLNQFVGGSSSNIVPDNAKLTIDMRVVPSQDIQQIKAMILSKVDELNQAKPELQCQVEWLNEKLPLKVEENHSFVQLVQQVISNNTALEPNPIGLSIYTDASEFIKATKEFPIVVVGPGETSQAHVIDEYLELERYYESIVIYEDIIEGYLV